jgi:hypothetical protein
MVLSIFNFGVNFFYHIFLGILCWEAHDGMAGKPRLGRVMSNELRVGKDDGEDEKWCGYYYPFYRPTERDQTIKWIVCISNTNIQYFYLSVAYPY